MKKSKSDTPLADSKLSKLLGHEFDDEFVSSVPEFIRAGGSIDQRKLVKLFFTLRDAASERLSSAVREDRNDLHDFFGGAARLRLISEQFLCHAIEDEGVDLRDVAPKIVKAFGGYFNSGDEAELWSVYEELVTKKPIATRTVELKVAGKDLTILASIPEVGEANIPVSTSAYPLVPIVEQTVADPSRCHKLADAYARLIEEFASEVHVDKICFVEKSVGPVGALGLMSSLVEKTGIPAVVYRERYFADRGKISGSSITVGETVLLVYDLIVSGQGLKGVAKNLQEHFDVATAGAVVLFNYRDVDEIEGETPLPTKTIARYSDFSDEVGKIIENKVVSEGNVKLLDENDVADRRRIDNSAAMSVSSQGTGVDQVIDDRTVVLEFESKEAFKAAVHAYYEDDSLVGYEIDTADGRSLIVPKVSVPSLERLGINFVTSF